MGNLWLQRCRKTYSGAKTKIFRHSSQPLLHQLRNRLAWDQIARVWVVFSTRCRILGQAIHNSGPLRFLERCSRLLFPNDYLHPPFNQMCNQLINKHPQTKCAIHLMTTTMIRASIHRNPIPSKWPMAEPLLRLAPRLPRRASHSHHSNRLRLLYSNKLLMCKSNLRKTTYLLLRILSKVWGKLFAICSLLSERLLLRSSKGKFEHDHS
mmetsp:Transcript_5723/g.11346  ORF Transcript_5723/g.11346 Transcript_5723/m.11346 type:complete len:209 (+) Transcript_5723:649-1275(+)